MTLHVNVYLLMSNNDTLNILMGICENTSRVQAKTDLWIIGGGHMAQCWAF